jgi:predicted Zn-dependent protease
VTWIRYRGRVFGALSFTWLALACSVNPVTRQSEVVLATPEQEAEAGKRGSEQVAIEMGIVEDRRLSALVDAVGKRVAAHAPQGELTYRFQIVDQVEPNAFALPGGYVYVSRGLLVICNSEDELANVLAHEVVHVAARHHAQRHTRAAGIGLLALPGLLAGALLPGVVGDLVSAPFAVAGLGALAAYSRDQEREADRYGQDMAAAAGYDPRALGGFLATLEREVEILVENPRNPSFLDTHPTTPSRAKDAVRRADDLSWQAHAGVAGDRDGFLRRLDGVLVDENPAEGVFEGNRFLHPDLDFTLVFPKDWETINTRSAVGAVPKRADAQVSLRLAEKGNDPREAASAFLNEASQHTRMDVAHTEGRKINGLHAVNVLAVARGRSGSVNLDLTWIGYRGHVYMLTGVVPGRYTDEHRKLFAQVADGFRPLQSAERQRIQEKRLRLRAAQSGETFASLGRRTGNAWNVDQTAVANASPVDASLAEGRLVKIAVAQPYGSGAR